MGYVQGFEDGTGKKGSRSNSGKGTAEERRIVGVQAVMLWSAGNVKLGEYEKAVELRKGIEIGKG